MRKVLTFLAFAGLQSLLPISALAATSAAISFDSNPPKGFEDLTEPSSIVLDVYYGGRLLANNLTALVGPETLQFEQPQAVLDKLPATAQYEALLQRLSSVLSTNSHLVCQRAQQTGCGVIDAEVLEVIYNPDRFRVDIFINREYLPTRAAIIDPYLPPASNRFAISQRLSGSWAGARTDSDGNAVSSSSATLFGDSIVSFGESSLQSRWSVSDSDLSNNGQVSDLFWTRDYRGKALSAGLFQPRGSSSLFINSGALYGIEYYKSDNTRTDNDQRTGTPLEVHLPVRGRVEVYRDGRLIHSELLEAGNQLLATRSFPQGAYEVTVRTFSEDGRPLNEFTQFFAKDSLLPTMGEWQWNVMLGTPALLSSESLMPEASDETLLQAGVGRRLLDEFGLFATATFTEEQQALELGSRWINEYFELSPSVIATDDGRSGFRLSASLKTDWATLSVQESRLDGPERFVTGNVLPRGFAYRTYSLFVPMGKGRLNARYSQRDGGLTYADEQLQLPELFAGNEPLRTLEYQRPLLRNRSWYGDLRLAYSDSGIDRVTSLNFQFRYRSKRWNHGTFLRSDSGSLEGERNFAGFSSSWDDRDLWANEVQQQFFAETDGNAHSMRSNTRVAGRRGHFSSSVNYLDNSGSENIGNTLSYVGNFSTNLVSDGDYYGWGGEQGFGSGVLVEVDGAKDDEFEILVNGQRRGYATGGGRSLISVPAYDTYSVTVKPLSSGFYDYQDNSETVTLYPGNIASTRYEIKTLVMVFGRIIRNGKPVANATFEIEGQQTRTNEYGVFQLDYYGVPKKLVSTAIQWNNCTVPVTEQSSDKDWLNLGTIELNTASCKSDATTLARK